MPIFRQTDVFEDELEDDLDTPDPARTPEPEPEPVHVPDPPKHIQKPVEAEEDEDEEEEEEKPKPKKKKQKKRSAATTKKLIAFGVGSTALIAIMVVTSIGLSVKKKAAEEAKRQEELYAEVAKSYTPLEADDNTEAETEVEQDISSVSSYTDKELRALRKWGYTASEISIAERDGLSAKDLVESAKEDREEAQKEALAAVSDTASDEYKNLLDKTWLGGEELDVSAFTSDLIYMPNERVENVDYVKCEPHNQQCFIKLMLDNGVPAFMYISPDRYNELPDSGNMVVNIQTVTANDVEVITSITEQRVN